MHLRLLLSLQVLLEVSCGSGLFSRRFVGSKKFDRIVASDLSENMLKQAGNFFAKDLSLDGRFVTGCGLVVPPQAQPHSIRLRLSALQPLQLAEGRRGAPAL